MRQGVRASLLLALAFSVLGCATYQSKVDSARRLITTGNFDEALPKFKELAEKEDGDQLPHLLDYGTALHLAGKIDESNEVFLKADRLVEQLDYHSVSKITGSLLFSEEMVQYKGDTFEKIFINAFLAMNFLEKGNLENALVASRQINEKYLRYRANEDKSYALNPFAKYLAAMCWEANKDWDSAYISYKEAYSLSSSIVGIEGDLLRTAKLARREDEYKRWKAQLTGASENPQWYDRRHGELVVIVHQGWGPRKSPRPESPRFPMLNPVYSNTRKAEILLDGKNFGESGVVYNVQAASIQTLQEDYGSLVAKRLGGIVAKEIVADQIRQKNEALGFIAWIGMHVSDRADLRQWSLLPETIQVFRIMLAPGEYTLRIRGLSYSGSFSGEESKDIPISIKANQKVFKNWRSLY